MKNTRKKQEAEQDQVKPTPWSSIRGCTAAFVEMQADKKLLKGFRALTSKATDCLAQDFFTWSYMMVLLMPSPQKMTNAWEETSRQAGLITANKPSTPPQRWKNQSKRIPQKGAGLHHQTVSHPVGSALGQHLVIKSEHNKSMISFGSREADTHSPPTPIKRGLNPHFHVMHYEWKFSWDTLTSRWKQQQHQHSGPDFSSPKCWDYISFNGNFDTGSIHCSGAQQPSLSCYASCLDGIN